MKIKKTTLILVALAFGAAGLVFGLDYTQKKAALETAKEKNGVMLFDFKETEASAVTVQTIAGKTLVFERTEQSFPNAWAMTAPKQGVADEAAIAFLLDQMSKSKTKRSLEISLDQKQDFGFRAINPTAKIQLKNKQTHELVLGGNTFDGQGLYALVDPPTPRPATLRVSIVDRALYDAIERPLIEWEYKPEKFPRPSSDTPSTPDGSSKSNPFKSNTQDNPSDSRPEN